MQWRDKMKGKDIFLNCGKDIIGQIFSKYSEDFKKLHLMLLQMRLKVL